MSIIQNIQTYFFKKNISAVKVTSTRAAHTLQSAKTILLLFDASSDTEIKQVQDQRDFWANEGKTVVLIGFDSRKNATFKQAEHFTRLTKKEFTWNGGLKKSIFNLPKPCDLLLCFNPNQSRNIHFLTTASVAQMKVGTNPEEGLEHDLDLIIELPNGATATHFFENLKTYLHTIKQAHT